MTQKNMNNLVCIRIPHRTDAIPQQGEQVCQTASSIDSYLLGLSASDNMKLLRMIIVQYPKNLVESSVLFCGQERNRMYNDRSHRLPTIRLK